MISRKLLGIWGGTFDPVHFGHLFSALELKALLGLDELRLVPCAQPVHRKLPQASAVQRLEMLRSAVAMFPDLRVDAVEVERGGPSFAVDTLLAFRHLYPPPILCLIMGSDAFQFFTRWHRWEMILEMSHVVVVQRPGCSLLVDSEEFRLLERNKIAPEEIRQRGAGGILPVLLKEYPVAATLLRRKLAAGESVSELTPDAVIEWIKVHRLYQG